MADQPPVHRDRVEIRGLDVVSYCGVLDEEQARPQPFRIDVDLYLDLVDAGQTDDLAATADYGAITDRVVAMLGVERYLLVERMAQRVADVAFDEASRIEAVTVRIRKLRPPIGAAVDTTGVRIHRTRPDAEAAPRS
ncbi:MAG: dihydroneopterin aldolase [Actinomycetota bacterium]